MPETLSFSGNAAHLDLAIGEAEGSRELIEEPDKAEDYTADMDKRLAVVQDRLRLLGYKMPKPIMGMAATHVLQQDNVRTAIKTFQATAGLVPDSWAGPKTWQALQELVSFEDDTCVDEWFDRPESQELLERAVVLRLYTLGLADSSPPEAGKPKAKKKLKALLDEGLDDFVTVLKMMPNGAAPPPLEDRRAVYKRLFDQDSHVAALAFDADNQDAVVARVEGKTEREKEEKRELFRGFAFGVALIELWLGGYDVDLVRGKSEPRKSRGVEDMVTKETKDFWKDQKAAGRKIPRKNNKGKVSGYLFGRLKEMSLPAASPEEEHKEDAALAKALDTVEKDKPFAEDVQDRMQSLLSRIWDGIKRAVRWIARLFIKLGKAALRFATNVARYAKNLAIGVYKTVKTCIRAVANGLDFLTDGTVDHSDTRHVDIHFSFDMDGRVYCNPDGDTPRIQAMGDYLRVRGQLFKAASHIVGGLFAIFRRILARGLVSGAFNPIFGLIIALAQTTRLFAQLFRDAKWAGTLLQSIKLWEDRITALETA